MEGSSEAYAQRCSRACPPRPSLPATERPGWSGRCARLRISHWPVGQKDDARVERGRRDQAHQDLAAVEGPVAAAPDRGVDPEVDLVGESLFGELVANFPPAEGDQVPEVPGLEAGHALGELARDQRRVPLERLLQGPGGD